MVEKEEVKFLTDRIRLSKREIMRAAKFIDDHRNCPTTQIQFDHNVNFSIEFSVGKKPMSPTRIVITCDKCHEKRDITISIKIV